MPNAKGAILCDRPGFRADIWVCSQKEHGFTDTDHGHAIFWAEKGEGENA